MITLTLLHPLQSIPVQSWTFERESVIRIGRSTDNDVILYSAVVSRHHVEIRCTDSKWEIVNLGANGTYLDGKRITQVPLVDGVTIRLARSGPNIQIHVGDSAIKGPVNKFSGEETLSQRARIKSSEPSPPPSPESKAPGTIPVPPHLQLPPDEANPPKTNFDRTLPPLDDEDSPHEHETVGLTQCLHPRTTADQLFCLDCGEPINVMKTIGEYKILKVLGQGGMGLTYLAWRDKQTVVLKTLNLEWVTHAKALELFERETLTLQQLSHPAIPRFIEAFSIGGQPYLVMEMIYGQNLGRQVVIQGSVSQSQAIQWVLQICDVLEYLHSHNPPIFHRDIKPENLIRRSVAREGYEIAVVDFGAVRIAALEAGTNIGSAGYAAPEQESGQATAASDLYSVGATLVYLMTGQEPSTFCAHREQGFRLYAEYVPGLSPEMTGIVRTLTNPKPEDRYASAADLADALQELLKGSG